MVKVIPTGHCLIRRKIQYISNYIEVSVLIFFIPYVIISIFCAFPVQRRPNFLSEVEVEVSVCVCVKILINLV